jgi:hypothetical protein
VPISRAGVEVARHGNSFEDRRSDVHGASYATRCAAQNV